MVVQSVPWDNSSVPIFRKSSEKQQRMSDTKHSCAQRFIGLGGNRLTGDFASDDSMGVRALT